MTSISSIQLSGLTTNSRTSVGELIGNITVPLVPPEDAFSGGLTLSGPSMHNFQILVSPAGAYSLVTAAQLPVGPYSVSITATQAGLTNSPFTQAFVIQSLDPTAHQNAPPIPFPHLSTPFVDENRNLDSSWIRFMTNVWTQTNGSPFGLNSNSPAPASPPAGQGIIYIDPADGGLKVKFPTGNVVVLGMP